MKEKELLEQKIDLVQNQLNTISTEIHERLNLMSKQIDEVEFTAEINKALLGAFSEMFKQVGNFKGMVDNVIKKLEKEYKKK